MEPDQTFLPCSKVYPLSEPRYKTKAGIRVRSKIEKIIADFFSDQCIDFEYEPRLRLGTYVVHPDFYLPEFQVYHEHFGLNRSEYLEKARLKILAYRRAGVRFFYTGVADEPDIEDIIVDKLADVPLSDDDC